MGGIGLGAVGAVGGIGALLYELSKTPTTPQERSDSDYARKTLSPRLGPASSLNKLSPVPAPIAAEVAEQAKAQGVDPQHMQNLARVEGGNYGRISPAGAIRP